MNDKFEDLMYEAGLTAQGCWDEMDQYNQQAILKFGELIVRAINNEFDSDMFQDWLYNQGWLKTNDQA